MSNNLPISVFNIATVLLRGGGFDVVAKEKSSSIATAVVSRLNTYLTESDISKLKCIDKKDVTTILKAYNQKLNEIPEIKRSKLGAEGKASVMKSAIGTLGRKNEVEIYKELVSQMIRDITKKHN